MERQRLIGAALTGLVLLVGATYRWNHERPVWVLIGVASTGDTLWIDVNQHEAEFGGALVNGPTQRREFLNIRVDCARRVTRESDIPAVVELGRAVADTACTYWR